MLLQDAVRAVVDSACFVPCGLQVPLAAACSYVAPTTVVYGTLVDWSHNVALPLIGTGVLAAAE